MLTMAKRKGKALQVWLPDSLRDALDVAAEKNRRKIREEVAIALEKYLSELRLWPPAPKPKAPPQR